MKKITAISLVILLIAAMVHISVAVHYCGGKEVASKVSLTSVLATCGMESYEKALPAGGDVLSSHCCKDVVTMCGTDNNYTPSYSYIPEYHNSDFSIVGVPALCTIDTPSVLISQFANIRPPGECLPNNVELSDICVFRI